MSYTSDKNAFNAAINTDISTQTTPNSIPPEVVGAGYTDLADLLEPYINAINNQALLFGTGVPSDLVGQDLDLYFQQTNPINLYRKLSGSWVLQGSLPIDFTLPEGNLSVMTSITGFTVTASRGGWVINNTVYQKATQTLITVTGADANLDRYDLIYADELNQILYLQGTASVSPVVPSLPADTTMIDTVIVPSVASNNTPYLVFGGGGNTQIEDAILNQTDVAQVANFRIDGSGQWEDGGNIATASSAGFSAAGDSSVSMQVENTAGSENVIVRPYSLEFNRPSGFMGDIQAPSLTVDRSWNLPDASGTLALEESVATGFIQNQDAVIQDAKFSISDSAHVGGYGLTETFVSPQITGHQGYATDGAFHYITDTAQIDKRNNDGTWSIALSNTTPYAGLTGTVNHLGDLSYYSGVLYVPVENLVSNVASNQKIVTYNSTTLALIAEFDISAQGHESSGVAIDGPNNIAYVISYYDGTKIWKYNATTFAFLGTISLSIDIPKIQGVSHDNGLIYVASESNGIYTVDPLTGDVIFLLAPLAEFTVPEGVEVIAGQVRWLIDLVGGGVSSKVYYYDPSSDSAVFYTDKTGTSYYGNNLAVKNKLSVRTESIEGSLSIGTQRGYDTAIYMEHLADTVGVGSIVHDGPVTGLMNNAYFSQGNYQRSDVTKDSFGVFVNNTLDRIEFRHSSAAVGTINWNTRLFQNLAGDLNIDSSSTSAIIASTAISSQNAATLRNTNSLGATSWVCTNDTNTITFGSGVKNSASTLDSSFGAVGEGYIRAGGSTVGLSISSISGPIRFLVSTGTERMRLFANGNFIVGGTTDGGFKLDVQGTTRIQNTIDVYGGNAVALLLGGTSSSATLRTDSTDKAARYASPHYLNAEEPMAVIFSNATVAANTINVGGGSGIMNAATLINFYTAANNATTGGTIRAFIDSSGNFTSNNAQSYPTKQTHTAGATVTFSNNTRSLYVNPAANLAALTITMPSSPLDGQEVLISFGGTILSGSVVTTLIIQGNTGHTVLAGASITTAVAGDGYILKFESSTNLWRIF